MKKKVRIKSLPKGYHVMPDGTVMKDSAHMAEGGMVNKNLSPIPRGMANLEAEKGEVAMTDLGNTGMMGLYNIGGERHSNGGTPLNLDPGSFIYSDTKKMKIKDPEFLAKYGKTKPTTPAKLVKPFLGVNDFTNTLYDQNADPIQKRTAQAMIDKYKGKAGEIAFYQEAMKGFPQGVPTVAQEYAEGIMDTPMMAYGGYLPKAQLGLRNLYGVTDYNPFSVNRASVSQPSVGPRPVPRVSVPNPRTNSQERISVYSPEEMALYEAAQNLEGATYSPGMTALANDKSRPARQGMRPDKSYGEEDITSAEALADLRARQPWIFEEKPNWDFSNPEDVKWAQKTYEDRRKKYFQEQGLTYTPYFRDKSDPNYRPGEAFDAKFGEHTFNMPSLEIKGKPTTPPTPTTKTPDGTTEVPKLTTSKPGPTYAFQQDVNNIYTNLANRLSERRELPYAGRLSQTPFDPTYLDDTRQQQQIQGQFKGALDALGAFAGPSRQLSSAALLSGQAGEQAANVAATMGNQNVGIGNWANQFNAQNKGQTDARNLGLAMNLYDQTVKANEVFAEKMRAYRTQGNRLTNQMETNRAKAQLFNQLYPDFQINTMPGMYGEITANPEVLRAMQDPEKYKNLQSDRRQQLMNRVTQEAFTFFPEKITQDGKDENAAARADYIKSLMTGKNSEVEANPMSDPLRMLSALFSQYGGY